MFVPPLTEKADTTRYFIVSHSYRSALGKGGSGYSTVTTTGTYINRDAYTAATANNVGASPQDIIITNIIELSKSDYEDFIR